MNNFFNGFAKMAGTSPTQIAKELNEELDYSVPLSNFSEAMSGNGRNNLKFTVIRREAYKKLRKSVYDTVRVYVPTVQPTDIIMAGLDGTVFVFDANMNQRGHFTPV